MSGLLFYGRSSRRELEPAGFDLGRWLGQRERSPRLQEGAPRRRPRLFGGSVTRSFIVPRAHLGGLLFEETGLEPAQRHRFLSRLHEFGPAYYLVAELMHVTPEEYRAIAPHVSLEGVRWEGAVIALLPENREQVATAVAGLIERVKPAKEKAPLSFDAC